MDETSEILKKRKEKIDALRRDDIRIFPNDFAVTHSVEEVRAAIDPEAKEPGDDAPVFSVAGRIMAINRFGKSAFIRFKDRTGTIQTYIHKDRAGEDGLSLLKRLDIGDFIGVRGPLFATRTGEWSLMALELRLVSKAFRPLPEKFHGLKDQEKRYRRRYLDLIMNPDSRDIFVKRAKIVKAIRDFLTQRDFLEVETPMMHPIPGGAEAEPFKTHHNALGMDLFLRIAPELYLKRLVVGGFERVFEINRNFRNEGISTKHNPEFTMLEFYQAYADYRDLMDLTREMLSHAAREAAGASVVSYQGERIDFGGEWREMTLMSAMEEIAGADPAILNDRAALLEFAASRQVQLTKTESVGKIIAKLFDALVEPRLIQPTFITQYPAEISPLSRKSDADPRFTDRFELFIAGYEIANGFSELNDPQDQKERFLKQVESRKAGDREAHEMDGDYIEALEYGMPPTAGEGIGIDRLAMLLTDSASIRDVILFPQLKRN
ncbi:lysine tRNA synthetase, inducible [Candidatus Desulfarcum epimagneticum]|uniref:Lysine--tRNA ligase n=1 Tax=uncultured Desulfobacteraceae bacterium TaxID=218296 RepID=A0A484HJY5_9BACT|nr:lysine tRNA synthetase, inducible [uncultured Desulfobacteraceae bacterium]